MTTITYKVSKKGYEIKVEGHSGYANAGSDIVCASISTLMLSNYNLSTMLLKNVIFKSDERKPSMELTINHHNTIAKAIVTNLIYFMLDLEEQYPKYVKVEEIK